MKMVSKFFFVCIIIFFIQFDVQGNSKKEKNLLLETIGVLSAQGVYLTYVSIGSICDGYVHKAYDKDFTNKALESYIKVTNISKEQLNKLIKQKVLTNEDIHFVKELILTYNLLIAQANSFQQYVKTNNNTDLQGYDNNRKQAWKKISKLLNIKD